MTKSTRPQTFMSRGDGQFDRLLDKAQNGDVWQTTGVPNEASIFLSGAGDVSTLERGIVYSRSAGGGLSGGEDYVYLAPFDGGQYETLYHAYSTNFFREPVLFRAKTNGAILASNWAGGAYILEELLPAVYLEDIQFPHRRIYAATEDVFGRQDGSFYLFFNNGTPFRRITPHPGGTATVEITILSEFDFHGDPILITHNCILVGSPLMKIDLNGPDRFVFTPAGEKVSSTFAAHSGDIPILLGGYGGDSGSTHGALMRYDEAKNQAIPIQPDLNWAWMGQAPGALSSPGNCLFPYANMEGKVELWQTNGAARGTHAVAFSGGPAAFDQIKSPQATGFL